MPVDPKGPDVALRSQAESSATADTVTATVTAAAGLLQTGVTCWRTAHARRARLLIDGAAYFAALREAFINAKHTIFIAGWDIDSRMKLVGDPALEPADGLPVTLGALLEALVKRRPELTVRILLWDFAMLYALDREPLPSLTLGWRTPKRINLCLDDMLPLGGCHHQKIVVVDDSLAFCGGIDLTSRRWDTPAHRPVEPRRVDASGEDYCAVHDLQMMVDGEAACALGDLVRGRWLSAAAEDVPCAKDGATPGAELWPDNCQPHLENIAVGLSRTVPEYDGQPGVREVETLYRAAIAGAERTIYIENQFLTADSVSVALAERLRDRPDLEVVIVVPGVHESWVEANAMEIGRNRFMHRLAQAGVMDRVRLMTPCHKKEPGDGRILVHAKMMIVDDDVLHVGSANLNNRSMGYDTECDLTLPATDETGRYAIAGLRARLLAEHLGVEPEVVALAFSETGSLLQVVDSLAGRSEGRTLATVEFGSPDGSLLSSAITLVADPEEPVPAERFADSMFAVHPAPSGFRRLIVLGAVALAVLVLALAWRAGPGAGWIDGDAISDLLETVGRHPLAPLAVVGLYVVAGLTFFPITVLIAVTGAVFGGATAVAYAATGSLMAALAGFAIGRILARTKPVQSALGSYLGSRFRRVRRALSKKGILAITLVRMVPAAPFTAINLAAGASPVRLMDYLWGTVFGMAPGILLTAILGEQIMNLLTDPTPTNIAWLAGAVSLWIAGLLGVQWVASRLRDRGRSDSGDKDSGNSPRSKAESGAKEPKARK